MVAVVAVKVWRTHSVQTAVLAHQAVPVYGVDVRRAPQKQLDYGEPARTCGMVQRPTTIGIPRVHVYAGVE